MANDISICVGTVGQGIWQSPDGGEHWAMVRDPFQIEAQVRALTAHPTKPSVIYAGANTGVYVSNDKGVSWEHLDSPMNSLHVWSIAIDPTDPDTIFAGTRPPMVFRSKDAGKNWEKLPVEMATECSIGVPRITALVVDPVDHRNVWAGVEIDGVYRSLDGGDSWTRVEDGVSDPDIHGIAVSPGNPRNVLVSTPHEVFASSDVGESWRSMVKTEDFPLAYCRWVAVKPDEPQVVFAANGSGAYGSTGGIQRSSDGGESWQSMPLPVEPNSSIWDFAFHPADPNTIVANTLYGEVYTSNDGGATWDKLKREFGEVRAVAWMPN